MGETLNVVFALEILFFSVCARVFLGVCVSRFDEAYAGRKSNKIVDDMPPLRLYGELSVGLPASAATPSMTL